MKSIMTRLHQRQRFIILLLHICLYSCPSVDGRLFGYNKRNKNDNNDPNDITDIVVGDDVKISSDGAKHFHNDNSGDDFAINELLYSLISSPERNNNEQVVEDDDEEGEDEDIGHDNEDVKFYEVGEDKNKDIKPNVPPVPTCNARTLSPISDWHHTNVNDADSFHNYEKYEDFLEGPALLMDDEDMKFAVCEFLPLPRYQHFSHAMQQLLRCFSWFAGHPNKPSRIIWKHETFFDNILTDNLVSFLHKYYKTRLILNDTENIYSNYIVRSKNTTGLLDKTYDGNFLTDFAMLDMKHANEFQSLFYNHISNYVQGNNTRTYRSINSRTNKKVGIEMELVGCTQMKRHPRIGILNRLSASKRYIVNDDELLNAIQHSHPIVELIYLEDMTFPDQIKKMMSLDIIISPHGSQLQHIMFMPSQGCSSVIELLPPDSFVPDFYGSLSKLFNISHSFFYMNDKIDLEHMMESEDTGHETKYHKVLSTQRINEHICLDTTKVVNAVKTLISDWNRCCTLILS